MNVKKGSKIGLLLADGSSLDYEVREAVSLGHFMDTLERLAELEADMRPKGANDK